MIRAEGFILLPVPIPPMLEQVLGYPGRFHRPTDQSAQYCGFYWAQGGNKVACDDGQGSSIGMIHSDAFLAFVRHRCVSPYVREYNYGSSVDSAEYYLVLDRKARKLYVAPVAAAWQFLAQQWGPPIQGEPLHVADQEELLRLVKDALNLDTWQETTTTGSTAQLLQAMREEQEAVQVMITWLDSLN